MPSKTLTKNGRRSVKQGGRTKRRSAGSLPHAQILKVPLVLSTQPEGGYTVTSPLLPELVTEADRIEDVYKNVPDALASVLEIYEDLKKPLPRSLRQDPRSAHIDFDWVVVRS